MVINQNGSGLNRMLHQIFDGWKIPTMWNLQKNVWWIRKNSNHVKFTEECLMNTEKFQPCEIYRRMSDEYGKSYFSQQIFTNGLNYLKQYGIIFQKMTDQTASQWREILKTNALILSDRKDTIVIISDDMGILWVQHTNLCVRTLPFLYLEVIRFYQDNAKPDTEAKTAVTIYQLWIGTISSVQSRYSPYLFFICFTSSKNFCVEQSF